MKNGEQVFHKLKLSARYWLLGMAETDVGYFKVIEAMEFCLEKHNGFRNGGAPEAIHQLGIFHTLRTLHRHIKNPVVVYCAAFLHDVVEDKGVSIQEIRIRFGDRIADVVALLTKFEGYVLAEYLKAIFEDEDASIVKFADRINNLGSAVGVFKYKRLLKYFNESTNDFMPSFKISRRKFPHQEAVYENFKLVMMNQLNMIEAVLEMMPKDEVANHVGH